MMRCMSAPDSFEPRKKTLGEILASTSPPLRIPDFQRDYSWGKDQVTEFWEDLVEFAGADPKKKPTSEYFLGATVLVNGGDHHQVLDGQQRLASATILLAAIRDKMVDYKEGAAQQLQDNFILFVDQVTGETIARLQLNLFDRDFFRDFIQKFPRDIANPPEPKQKSHFLIREAYKFFFEKISEGWDKAGGGKGGFDWIGHISSALRQHVALINTIASNGRSAGLIFTSLNDRGIGLSSVDLVRSTILQGAHETQREEILKCWEAMFAACGRDIGAESLMRISWVARRGDLKSRALYRVVTEALDADDSGDASLKFSRQLKSDALLYRKLRDGDTDDPDLEEYWLSLRFLKFNAGYPLFIAADRFSLEDQKKLGRALRILILRHNVVCNLDRASLESLAFSCAKMISDGGAVVDVIAKLRERSPSVEVFAQNFLQLKFSVTEHGVARYLLELFDEELATTEEVDIAGAQRVHVEHIYPQQPMPEEKWVAHDKYVQKLGNLTLLDKRLNLQVKNSSFGIKKPFYESSRLIVTRQLLAYPDWSPERVDDRQAALLELAAKIWPAELVAD
jgi:Protein of unknown function DUF262/Protein of unknown function (DUF1524)